MRKPEWLRIKKSRIFDDSIATEQLIRSYNLHTVCENAQCPNKGECYSKKTATFLILGNICTRNCTFCTVSKETELIKNPNPQEPELVAQAVKEMNLDYIVITMVTRDDLPDGGAGHLAAVMESIRDIYHPEALMEVLVSDLQGNKVALRRILQAEPAVFNHNIETVSRLYPLVRPQADYSRSLEILNEANGFYPSIPTKSGFMLGMGEKEEEIISLMNDLRSVSVDILTIGQYLAPSAKHFPISEYVRPEKFAYYRQTALEMGFKACFSAPLVRSSYNAKESFDLLNKKCLTKDKVGDDLISDRSDFPLIKKQKTVTTGPGIN